MAAFNKLLADRDQLVEDCEVMLAFLTDTTEIDSKLQELRSEQEVLVGITQKLIADHASTAQGSSDYNERYDSLVQRYEKLAQQIQELDAQKTQRTDRADLITVYLRNIIEADGFLKEFDPRIWLEVVEKVTIFHDKRVVFTFQDGKEVAS